MINISKPIKTILLHSDKIVDDIINPLANRKNYTIGTSTIIPVYCCRLVGVTEPVNCYYDSLAELDCKLLGLGNLYLKFTENIPILIDNDLSLKISNIWQDKFFKIETEELVSTLGIPGLLSEAPLGPLTTGLQRSFMDIINLYKKNSPAITSTIFKNFCIKMLCWLKKYALPIFTNIDFQGTVHNPKVLFYGNIKEHEVYFLLILSKLGADVLYINTLTDGKFTEIDNNNAHSYSVKLPKTDELKKFPVNAIPQNNTPGGQYNPSFPPTVQSPVQSPVQNPIQNPIQQPVQTPVQTPPSIPVTGSPIERRDFPRNGKREMSLEELARLSASTVMILAFNEAGELLHSGSGVVIGSNGLLVTNYHVLQGACFFGVLFEGMDEERPYFTHTVINANVHKDLALIKINFRTPPIEIFRTGDLVRGQRVVAIGSPFGLMNTFSDGIVSGFRKYDRFDFIQITTPISSGSSGGALLNMFGELVGITTQSYKDGQNLSLAVPSRYIIELLENKFTAMNIELMDKYFAFSYDRLTVNFDGFFSYLSNERDYKIAFLQSRYDQTNLRPYSKDRRFIDSIENFFIENIRSTVIKYGIEKYEFELMVSNMFFTYTYDKGRLMNKRWEYR